MKQFMDEDFLLSNETAKHLFHDIAEKEPIIDYHCHLNPQEIYEDVRYENITQVWLGGDHYKWRQMRSNGVDEAYITGNASDREKFQKWAETLEMAIGNPLYHWSHLELKKYFGYEGHLCGDTAEEVWNLTCEKLKSPELSARNLIRNSNVAALCTTDDPADSLIWHKKIREDGFEVKVLPAWRPDKAVAIRAEGFAEYIAKLSEAADMPIGSFEELTAVMDSRMDYFAANGCCVSDHGMDKVTCNPASPEKVDAIFRKALAGGEVSEEEALEYRTALMLYLGRGYAKRGWVMQLHLGVQRDLNKRLFGQIGPDAGIDAVGDPISYVELGRFLSALNDTDELPKTIIYSLNDADNEAIGTIIGCFQDSSAVGKIQHGSAWWFNDHKKGMTEHMTTLASLSLLGNFVGMLTDSRSFLSYARHEYFRRILCNLIGGWVENGEYPNDEKALKRIISGISCENARRYFGL